MSAAKTIDELFMRAMELTDPRERENYLNAACADAPDVRDQVDELLAIAPQMGSFLETPVAPQWAQDTIPQIVADNLCGQSLGPYRLVRLAGEGGMGEVYQAEQEKPMLRQVAIKVIRHGLASVSMLARFAHESHLLGLMDHPNVARVLDTGTTPSGNPFIALEWVEGVHITTFCDQERYTIRQRVALMVTVCQAVQHAHQKGIIHRDLKPSNVLVALKDGQAVPKVIDFGVARTTHADLPEQERMTQTGQIIGTIEYMAPEQAEPNHTDIDTRTDIYALGALLYELLTGTAPYSQGQFRQASFEERLRLIREVDPVRPSQQYVNLTDVEGLAAKRQTAVSHLRKQVANELDWICLKCLEKDRGRRYETTNALAQDLQRYLLGEPVQAGPPTIVYRFKKFASRNRKLLAAATVMGSLLLAAAVIGTWQAVRLGRLHQQSQVNLAAANKHLELAITAVDQFCSKVSEDLRLKEQDLRPLRKELLASAVEFQKQLVELRHRSGVARIDLAQAHARLGRLSMEIDSVDEAIASFRLAIGEYQTLAKDLSKTNLQRLDRAYCDVELARCYYHLGQLLGRSSKAPEGKVAATQAMEILERLVQSEPRSSEVRSTLAEVRVLQWNLANATQQFEEAEAFARAAIEDWDKLAKEHPHDQEWLLSLASAQSRLGTGLFHRSLSRSREAEALLLKSLEVFRQASDGTLTRSSHQLQLAETLRALGQICKATRRKDDAIRYMTDAIDTVDRVRLKQPSVRSHAIQLAGLYNDLSVVHALNGQPIEECHSLEMAIGLLDSLRFDVDMELTMAVATSLLGKHQLNNGNLTKAEPLLGRAIELAEKVLDRSPDDRHLSTAYPVMLEDRANLLIRQGKFAEALLDYDRAVQVATPMMRPPKRIARGGVYLQVGNHRRAMVEVRETLNELPPETSSHVWISVLKAGAKLCAQCSEKVNSDQQLSRDKQLQLAEEYAATAVNLLAQAFDKGFNDWESLTTIPELEPLYLREDFRALGREIATSESDSAQKLQAR